MKRLTTIELYKEKMKFSAGHFTVFSATEREPLHGHNFNVYAAFDTYVGDEGLTFDYRFYRSKIYELCRSLSHTFIIPAKSKHLQIEDAGDYYHIHFNKEVIPFLKTDVTLMPIYNASVEDLSQWFVEQLTADKTLVAEHQLQKVVVKVFSAPGQCGSATWHVGE